MTNEISIFDEYGNYSFPTDLVVDTPNTAIGTPLGLSLIENPSYLQMSKGAEKMKVSVTCEFDVPEEMVQTSIDKAVEREVKNQIRGEGLIRCENCSNSIILNHGRIMCSKWAGSTIKEGYCFRAERKAKTRRTRNDDRCDLDSAAE